MSTNAYSGAQVFAAFGNNLLQEIGDGDDAIQVEFTDDTTTVRTGVGGSAVVSINQSTAATVRVRLLRTSKSNDFMQRALNLWRSTGTFFPFILKDARGKEVHACAKAAVQKQPSSSHGKNAGDIEWTIVCPEMRSNQGGY